MSTLPEVKAVVVTRAEGPDGPLSSELKGLGLQVLLWPAVSTEATETGQLDAELARIRSFDWIVFASRHAVAAVTERVALRPPGLKVAAVGSATAQVLNQRGWTVDLLPDDANAAGLVAAFEARLTEARLTEARLTEARLTEARLTEARLTEARPTEAWLTEAWLTEARLTDARLTEARGVTARAPRVLFPASSRALPTIAAGLSQLGAEVVQVEAYRTEPASLDAEECRVLIARGEIGAVTFASPSAVIELERSLGKQDFDRLLETVVAVAIGPTTARELTERGRAPVLAESATLQGLARTTHRLLQTRH